MKKIIGITVFVLLLCSVAFAGNELLVADFDRGEPPNNVGGSYGTWNHDPNDDSQGCYFFAEPDDFKNPTKGSCIRLDYDVQSKNPAFNGFWMKLNGIDISEYSTLSFWVKGTSDGKFTSRFKVELKDKEGKRSIYPVQDVTPDWKEVKIDFKDTKAGLNWKSMSELVIVFDDIVATYKEGTIFVDHFVFKKEKVGKK